MASVLEHRSIRFDKPTVVQAVLECRFRDQPARRAASVRRVEFVDGDDGVGVEVDLAGQGSTASGTVALNCSQLAAALLRFCFNRRTPLPKAAKKSIRTDGNAVFLEIEYGWPSTPTGWA